MREIKFRVWHKKKRKWYHLPIKIFRLGYSNEMALSKTFGYDGSTKKTDDSSWENDSPEDYVLMQFTGLKDKNGKEIYEGDIIKSTMWKDTRGRFKKEIIEWDNDVSFFDGMFILERGAGFISELCHEDCEVVGNVYENPKLLKEEKL